jgi:phosphatidylglycerol:prolipoprotein diacylglycerol transferase
VRKPSDSDRALEPPPRAHGSRTGMEVTGFSCSTLDGVEPQALGVTCWLQVPGSGDPRSLAVRLVGRRVDVKGTGGPKERFDVTSTFNGVVPGSGPVSVTTRISDIAPGLWQVVATAPGRTARPGALLAGDDLTVPRSEGTGSTAWAPAVQALAPGVRLGAWPALVSTGAVAALIVMSTLAVHRDLGLGRFLIISIAACLVGLLGAKGYYLALHPSVWRTSLSAGMCIQGFVLAGIATLAGGAGLAGLSSGVVLDISAPGLMLGMAIGRLGCFLGGCCAGRPTASRWGLWSSDRRIGARRVPTQLIEGGTALVIGIAAFPAAWSGQPLLQGAVFAVVIALYTLVRQLLLPLRQVPRQTRHGRIAVMAAAILVIAAAVAVSLV